MFQRIKILILFLAVFPASVPAQDTEFEVKVYSFEDGLTHRNVFKVQQDPWGFIWIATINGLNKFDGHEFTHYLSHHVENHLPFDFISDMLVAPDSKIWLSSQNAITVLNPLNNDLEDINFDSSAVYNQPYNFSAMCFDAKNQGWLISHLNESGKSYLHKVSAEGKLKDIVECKGNYGKRAILHRDSFYFLSFEENSVSKINEAGRILKVYDFPALNIRKSQSAWVNQMQLLPDNTLWVLFNNGQVFYLRNDAEEFQLHPFVFPQNTSTATTFLVEESGDIWVGGLGNLWYFDASSGKVIDFNERIREIIKNTCNYRHIFKDNSGVIWISTDYGAVKLTKSDRLFTTYLSDGSEYCPDVICSMRGITEDDKGNIYFSYYNSIHILDQQTNSVRPLFPENDFYNNPFGLVYHKNALYTGNGKRIDLTTLKVDTLFNKTSTDLGHAMVDKDGLIWIGFRKWLFQYRPETKELRELSSHAEVIDTSTLDIHYLYQAPSDGAIWMGTLESGLYKLDKRKGIVAHFGAFEGSVPQFRNNKINGIYESADTTLWIATGNGLHRWKPKTGKFRIYDKNQGLPNNFINGLLSEGDSVLWLSTDNGLSRFDVVKEKFSNFYKQDGISANEFNRVSFYKAKNGRMYFGGMNGINAFYPSGKFSNERKYKDNKILFTEFSKLDGNYDSIITKKIGLSSLNTITLTHKDKFFSFNFALANYQNPTANTFSYILEGYDKDWSEPSPTNSAKYNSIPPGNYTFRVRASTGKGIWNNEEMAINVVIKEAFYKTWWFIGLCFLVVLAMFFGILEYRLYRSRQQKKELQRQVKARTMDLERAMKKTDELLLNILPEETAEELKTFGKAKAKRYDEVTVLFTDFKGFTKIAEQLEPEELVAEIDFCFRNFDSIIEKYNIEKIKTIGDAYMCAGGIPVQGCDFPQNVVLAALEIRDFMAALASERAQNGRKCFEIRIGVHTGKVVAGIVGTKKFQYDIWGDTVNVAAGMEDNSESGKVNISEATFNLVKDHFLCEPRGKVTVKNKGEIEMYFVERLNGL